MKTLILFAHTFWENSKVNKALLQSVQGAPNLTIENLTLSCPNGAIDVEAQKALLKNADSIIFQFPLFWFSTPSLLKEWQDRVLTGILYGSEPKLLEGKNFGIITTAGGAESSYDGHHGATIKDIFVPIYHSFKYLGTKPKEPFCIFSANAEKLPLEEYKAYLGV
ncbi:NAD(P)H-dependent oxidoreductase [uncultured Helicobacter sp.]|uniref:NAD(P)H-dependent oxidoreductase n=1 Tax=uncultured Helicobacter sp. TaxID=175537 RepID=UPI003750C1AE